jgi:hypothetical protein
MVADTWGDGIPLVSTTAMLKWFSWKDPKRLRLVLPHVTFRGTLITDARGK